MSERRNNIEEGEQGLEVALYKAVCVSNFRVSREKEIDITVSFKLQVPDNFRILR